MKVLTVHWLWLLIFILAPFNSHFINYNRFMNLKTICRFAAVILVTAPGCKKDASSTQNSKTTATTSNVDVYVAGSTLGTGGITVATYWKNGIASTIGNGIRTSQLKAIAVNGTDVYAIGTSVNTTHGQYVGALWTNGTESQLTTGTIISSANSIALNGSDVYIAGYFLTHAQKTVAAIWKNGIMTALADTVDNSEAYATVESNGHVYAAGFTTNNVGHIEATYWKDNIATVVSSDPVASIAYSMAVNGSDVYLAGSLANNQSPVYWKNGVVASVSGGALTILNAMAVSGTDIYFAGTTVSSISGGSNGYVATMWKNGSLTRLTDASSPASNATGMALNGSDVYIAGNGGYWKNGMLTQFGSTAETFGICVVPK